MSPDPYEGSFDVSNLQSFIATTMWEAIHLAQLIPPGKTLLSAGPLLSMLTEK